jgi:hypothetical protein
VLELKLCLRYQVIITTRTGISSGLCSLVVNIAACAIVRTPADDMVFAARLTVKLADSYVLARPNKTLLSSRSSLALMVSLLQKHIHAKT